MRDIVKGGESMRKWMILTMCVLMMVMNTTAWAGPEMVLVKAGGFQKEDTGFKSEVFSWLNTDPNVELAYDFEIGKYEITNAQFLEFLNDAEVPSNGYLNKHRVFNAASEYFEFHYENGKFTLKRNENTNYPVIEISRWGAVEYCNWLSEKNGLAKAYDRIGGLLDKNGKTTTEISQVEGYRLPTEDEWEYAARGGHKGIEDYKYAGSDFIEDVAWVRRNSLNENNPIYNGQGSHEIGQKKPNKLGLYDMSGNVGEWSHDFGMAFNFTTKLDPESIRQGIVRGGGWYSRPEFCTVSYRSSLRPSETHHTLGFRIARTLK